jgi:hypothetical protein
LTPSNLLIEKGKINEEENYKWEALEPLSQWTENRHHPEKYHVSKLL